MKNKGQKNGLNAAPLWLIYAAALKRIPIWTDPSEEIAQRSFKALYFTTSGNKKNKKKVFFVLEAAQTVECLGPFIVVGGRCPWCWNEATRCQKCCCSLPKLSDVTKSVANCSRISNLATFFKSIIFSWFFFFIIIFVFLCSSKAGDWTTLSHCWLVGISFSVYLWLSC